jgi:hypothetical protein
MSIKSSTVPPNYVDILMSAQATDLRIANATLPALIGPNEWTFSEINALGRGSEALAIWARNHPGASATFAASRTLNNTLISTDQTAKIEVQVK